MHSNLKKQSGNMLFILLVAIALLGALTAILVRSDSSSDDTGGTEQSIISGSDIMKYSSGLETAVASLIARGCSENTLSFETSILAGYSNPNTPVNGSCKVFNATGAGQTPDFSTIDPAISGSYIIANVGTANPDLVFNYKVTKETCIQINNSLGIPNNGTEGPPTDSMTGGTKFTGGYTSIGGAGGTIDVAGLSSKKAGCRHESGTGSAAVFIFYHTLLAR